MNDLEPDLINLIILCDRNPELANDVVSNAGRYHMLYKKSLEGIPASIALSKPLSCRELGRMVRVVGSIIKTYPVFFKNVMSEQTCLKCNEVFHFSEQEVSKLKGNPFCQACGACTLKVTQNFQHSFPIQVIKIQNMNNSSAMSEPIELSIEGEKAGTLKPGDKISATGIVMRKWKCLKPNEPMISTLYVKILQILKEEDEEDEFSEVKHLIDEYCAKSRFDRRAFIVNSFCSELYGLFNVKLGLLIALAGGAVGTKEPGAFRQNSHVLLVGDPATGKSHLLKAASKLVSPSVCTNGVGTSDAGLTTCAVRSGREWTLEAGALVLADNGVCLIDEFNKLKVNEKSGLLETMEQQTLSVAKAGMMTSLNSRCSVIAAASTRHGYDLRKSICDNLGMSAPLISRFDLIFGLFDKPRRDRDEQICDHVLSRDMPLKVPEHVRWSQSLLRMFITQCRKKKNKAPEEVCNILLKYYTRKRTLDGVSEFSTIRMLESLVRIAESHSKLMGEDAVTEEDAIVAVLLMETGINSAGTGDTGMEFVDEEAYLRAKQSVCVKYGIDLDVRFTKI